MPRLVKISLITIAIISGLASYFHRWQGNDGNGWEAIIDGDGKGSYAFLPAVFLYHDLTFSFYDEPGNKSIARYYNPRFRIETEDGVVNKNFCGAAFLMMPFFLSGHVLAVLTGEARNGYSWPYMLGVLSGAAFYLLAGLYFMAQVLLSFSVSIYAVCITILLTALGTNLLFYSAIHAAMPHVYSFFTISGYLFFTRWLLISGRNKYLIASGVMLGLIILIRPVNAIVLFSFPIIAGNRRVLNNFIFTATKRKLFFVLAVLCMMVLVSVQAVVFYAQVKQIWVWSYGDEGFLFGNPEILKVLVSFRKGLLIYTPALILLIPGIWVMFRQNRWMSLFTSGFVALLVYVLASWWNWYYGDGYGQRAFIDFYMVLFLPVAFAFNKLRGNRSRLAGYFIGGLFILLSLVQSYQYRYNIIHQSAMNFDKYKFVFLKTGAKYRNVLGGDRQLFYGKLGDNTLFSFFDAFSSETQQALTTDPDSLNFKFSGDIEFGPGVTFSAGKIFPVQGKVYLQSSVFWRELESMACQDAYFVCSITGDSGLLKYYSAHRIQDVPRKPGTKWHLFSTGLVLPETLDHSDSIVCYIWNKGKMSFSVDNFRVSVSPILPL